MGTMIQFLFWGISFITVWLSLVWIEFLLNPVKEERNNGALPSVTIGIPAYNEESTVGGTLESLAKLDYPKDKLKVIVANDGSTDGTAEIVKKYTQKYSFIRLINKEPSPMARKQEIAPIRFRLKLRNAILVVIDFVLEILPHRRNINQAIAPKTKIAARKVAIKMLPIMNESACQIARPQKTLSMGR